jgi:hypothetical protein
MTLKINLKRWFSPVLASVGFSVLRIGKWDTSFDGSCTSHNPSFLSNSSLTRWLLLVGLCSVYSRVEWHQQETQPRKSSSDHKAEYKVSLSFPETTHFLTSSHTRLGAPDHDSTNELHIVDPYSDSMSLNKYSNYRWYSHAEIYYFWNQCNNIPFEGFRIQIILMYQATAYHQIAIRYISRRWW